MSDSENEPIAEDQSDVEIEERTDFAADGNYDAVITAHTDAVFALAVNAQLQHIASGGKDDTIHVYDLQSNDIVTSITSHTDSVSCLVYTNDNRFLISGGMDRNVFVFSTENYVLLFHFTMSDSIEIMKLHSSDKYLLIGTTSGLCHLIELSSDGREQIYASHTDRITDLEFFQNDRKFASADAQGIMCIWDPKIVSHPFMRIHRNNTMNFHEGEIVCFKTISDRNLIITCGDDGRAIVTSLGNGKVLQTVLFSESPLECIAVNQKYAVIGNSERDIYCLNIGDMTVRHCLQAGEGCSLAKFLPGFEHCIVTAHTSGLIKVLDVRDGTVLKEFIGHTGLVHQIFFINNFMVTAGEDKNILLFAMQ